MRRRDSWRLLSTYSQLSFSQPPHEEVSMKLQRSLLLVLLGLALAAGATLWGCGRQDRLGSPVGVDLSRTSTPTAASSRALRATMDAQMPATPTPLPTHG